MIDVHLELRPNDLAWRTVYDVRRIYDRVSGRFERVQVTLRRTLFDTKSGEVLDDVWRDDHRRVRSYSRSRFA